MDIPKDWTFRTASVANGFDQHVREQLPWYDLMSGAVSHIARHYLPDDGVGYDLGCSTGNIGRCLEETIKSRNVEWLPVDSSEAMRNVYRGPGNFISADFAAMDFKPFDVAVAFLSFMFLTYEKRMKAFNLLRKRCKRGGAIIVVDKMQGIGGYLGTVLARLTIAGKMASGISSDQILAKELSLGGSQRPLAESEIMPATKVFQFGEFAGWVIERSVK